MMANDHYNAGNLLLEKGVATIVATTSVSVAIATPKHQSEVRTIHVQVVQDVAVSEAEGSGGSRRTRHNCGRHSSLSRLQ